MPGPVLGLREGTKKVSALEEYYKRFHGGKY